MKVTLINHTPNALATLLFTKGTRLQMSPTGLEEIADWPQEKQDAELAYMHHTIQSQFEFIDYVFMIEGVTRAFTHQLVRHRIGTSFAQQAQRVVNMEGFDYVAGPSIVSNPAASAIYDEAMATISGYYRMLLDAGVRTQDARGVLPTNIATNIVFKANLRTLHDMALKRLCVKTQGEFQDVFRAMIVAVTEVHPWAEQFLRAYCAVHGTCQFHTFPVDDCPAKRHVMNKETGEAYGGGSPMTPDEIHEIVMENRAEAQPIIPADPSRSIDHA
jgi:flavin-dependent thymidylate synthase